MGYYDDDETYDEHNGTYVQDVEGWSDQMIDGVLEESQMHTGILTKIAASAKGMFADA